MKHSILLLLVFFLFTQARAQYIKTKCTCPCHTEGGIHFISCCNDGYVYVLDSAKHEWHSANKMLTHRTGRGFHPTPLFFDKYDSVECVYIIKGDTTLYKGYKFIFLHDGWYTDDEHTFEVFYDEKWAVVKNVKKYYFTR